MQHQTHMGSETHMDYSSADRYPSSYSLMLPAAVIWWHFRKYSVGKNHMWAHCGPWFLIEVVYIKCRYDPSELCFKFIPHNYKMPEWNIFIHGYCWTDNAKSQGFYTLKDTVAWVKIFTTIRLRRSNDGIGFIMAIPISIRGCLLSE